MLGKKYVFVSYSTKDAFTVDSILLLLKGMSVSYWKAPQMIPAGSNYAREIPQAIKNCSLLLLFLSANSQSSMWVEKEIDTAINYRKQVVPVQLDEAPMNDVFRFYLNNVQMISYHRDPAEGCKELKELLLAEIKGIRNEGVQRNPYDISSAAAVSTAPAPVREFPATPGAERPQVRYKMNGNSLNRIPINCKYCGGGLKSAGNGVYRCSDCGADNYDDFRTITNYLQDHGPTPAPVLERELKIPRRIINEFRDDGHCDTSRSPRNRSAWGI